MIIIKAKSNEYSFPNSLNRDKLQKYMYMYTITKNVILTILNFHPAVIYKFHISNYAHILCRVSHVK